MKNNIFKVKDLIYLWKFSKLFTLNTNGVIL